MPIITVPSHAVRTRVLAPKAVYSRWVHCAAYTKDPVTQAFGYTPVVGMNTWLLGIRITFAPHIRGGADWIEFKVLTGTGVPTSYADILKWTDILPIIWGGKEVGSWVAYQEFRDFDREMSQLYTGEGRRFGISSNAVPLLGPQWVIAGFLISEG